MRPGARRHSEPAGAVGRCRVLRRSGRPGRTACGDRRSHLRARASPGACQARSTPGPELLTRRHGAGLPERLRARERRQGPDHLAAREPGVRIVMFYHSLVSDWNHGNAHFLRGIVAELVARGHDVQVLEPRGGWSRSHLVEERGPEAVDDFHQAYPTLTSTTYEPGAPDLNRVLDGADLVLVHEWNDHAVVRAIGAHRAMAGGYVLLFHDTHHRSVSAPAQMAA